MTPRDVDKWLRNLQAEINSMMAGPEGEIRARLGILEHRIEMWRDRLGVKGVTDPWKLRRIATVGHQNETPIKTDSDSAPAR